MNDATTRKQQEMAIIKRIAGGGDDGPVLMINLNRYRPEANFPDGAPYTDYMRVLEALLPEVGGKILWRTPVHGQPVGDAQVDEILAAWYPSHQAFLDLPAARGGKENFRLRRQCIEHAVIHRCDPVMVPGGSPASRQPSH
ncbi:MAG: hypothetical protein AAF513_16210 [Pseudomonadota bacterium]